VAFLVAVPLPHHFRAPGLVESGHWSALHTGVDGEVVQWLATPGNRVESGQPLAELRNPELELRERVARAELEEIEARIRQALQDAIPNLKPLESVRDSVQATLRQLGRDRGALVVRSPQAGVWSLPSPEEIRGRWLTRGSPLGSVFDDQGFRFHAVVPQEEADRLFGSPADRAEIRLEGESGRTLGTGQIQIIPAERQRLPSAALGWLGGGAVAVSDKDPEGRVVREPFFEVRATIEAVELQTLRHGRSGVIRFDLPAEPLLPRWIRSLRQLLQRRYQV
jgi:putative peptide zinc metalloprotease protein